MIIEPIIIITNNPMAKDRVEPKYNLTFIDGTVMDVFREVRDYVHKGHRILTHPLVSSVKPNEIPFRTIILSKNREEAVDLMSLTLIEDTVNVTLKFLKDFDFPNWSNKVLEDFQVIDYDLISHVINK